MTFVEAYWISQLALIVGVAVFYIEDQEHSCVTLWETVTSLGAQCPT